MRLSSAGIYAAALACLVQSAHSLTATCKPAAKPQAICGKTGTVSIDGVNQFLDARSCAAYCADIGNCGGFSHQPKNNLCTLYELLTGDDLIRNFYKVDPTGNTTLYVQPGCFSCDSTVCDVSPDFNLLNNPNFALSKKAIGPWDPSLVDSSPGSRGFQLIPNPVGQGNAIQYSLTSGTKSFSQSSQQYRQLCQNQTYRVQLDYKVDQVSDTPSGASKTDNVVEVTLFSGSCVNGVSYTFDDPQLGKWHHMECSFGFTGQFPLQFGVGPSLTQSAPKGLSWNVTVANLKMTQLFGRVKTKGASRVRNGGFESGKLAPWTATGEYFTRNGYDSSPAVPCAKNEPVSSIISPGFSQPGGSVKSKNKFRFCGAAAMREGDYYYPFQSAVLFTITQSVSTELDKTYVLSSQYGITNGNLESISYGPVDYSFVDEPLVGATNITRLDQRIFQGSGGVSTLKMEYFYEAKGKAFAELRLFLDNISIKEIDE